HRLYTDKQLKACWMFLYADYIPSCFYWESIVMFRKARSRKKAQCCSMHSRRYVAISSAMVFLAVSDVGVQVSTGAIIVLLFLALQLAAEPYSSRLLNRLEMSSQGVVLTNLLLSLYLTYPATQQSIATPITLSLAILIINVVLVLLFLWYLGRALHDLLLFQAGLERRNAKALSSKDLSHYLSTTYGRFAPLLAVPLRLGLILHSDLPARVLSAVEHGIANTLFCGRKEALEAQLADRSSRNTLHTQAYASSFRPLKLSVERLSPHMQSSSASKHPSSQNVK
ncbi:hypothetical protein QJQ45_016919, partial [Haematococcus lacustris]